MMLNIGLRWPRSQARTLRNIGNWVAANGTGDAGLFFKAAESAKDGEPLVVRCEDVSEVEEMAALFVQCGAKRPVLEQLTGY